MDQVILDDIKNRYSTYNIVIENDNLIMTKEQPKKISIQIQNISSYIQHNAVEFIYSQINRMIVSLE
jgi:hypothetical protein